MPKRIPQSFIADLLARIDIVEIIGSRVQLRKTGANYSALCPFHNEKTASFSVSQPKQFYYCFGCSAHGNAVNFLMEYDRMEFVDAIETLAQIAGVEIPYEMNQEQKTQLTDHYQTLLTVSRQYQHQLRHNPTAIDYLKDRGLDGTICKKYGVGFAVDAWDTITTKFNDKHQELITNGLLINNNGRTYDRFRQRVMFPIRDVRGRVIGFGGRALGDATPKYLNSPETPIFHKGSELYGLYEARQNNSNLAEIIIVEGYMDVLALAQHGITNVVATLGTATTSKHIHKLFRYTTKIIFCFDGDQAGFKAAWRALENTLPLMRDGVQAQFLFLPKGEDPDSFIRQQGKATFIEHVANAEPLSEFFFSYLAEQINLETMDGRAQMAHDAGKLLTTMPNGVFKQLMFEKLANITHVAVDQLLANQETPNNNAKPTSTKRAKFDLNQSPSLVKTAIKLLLNKPHLADYIEDFSQIANLELTDITILSQLLNLAKQHTNISAGALLELWDDREEAATLASLAAQELLITEHQLQSEFIGIISRLYQQGREQTITQLMQQASQGELTAADKQKLQKLISDAKIKLTTPPSEN